MCVCVCLVTKREIVGGRGEEVYIYCIYIEANIKCVQTW